MSREPFIYYSIVELNLEGILLMREDKVDDAISCFRRGMRLILNKVQSNPDSDVPLHGQAKDLLTTTQDSKMLFTCSCFDGPELDQHDDIFMLYRRALHYSPDSSMHATMNYHLLTGVVLYNMGLGCHIMGLRTSCSGYLSKAYECYSLAHATLATTQIKRVESSSYLLSLVFLAIANNIGHIHSYLRNFQEVRTCSEELAHQIRCRFNSVDPSFAECDDEHRVFFLNVCFYNESTVLAAPCA